MGVEPVSLGLEGDRERESQVPKGKKARRFLPKHSAEYLIIGGEQMKESMLRRWGGRWRRGGLKEIRGRVR